METWAGAVTVAARFQALVALTPCGTRFSQVSGMNSLGGSPVIDEASSPSDS